MEEAQRTGVVLCLGEQTGKFEPLPPPPPPPP